MGCSKNGTNFRRDFMANKNPLHMEVEALFHAKQKRRQALAKLPFEKKIKILLEMQKISHDLSRTKSRGKPPLWNISSA
jgi:hypothetical protein